MSKSKEIFEFFQIMWRRREFIFVSFHSSRSTPQGGDYQALPINSVTFIVEISHCVWHRRTPLWCARGTTQRSHPAAKAYSVKNEEFKHRVSATSVCSSTTPAGGRCAGPNKHIQKSSAVFNTHITKPTRFKGNLLQNFAWLTCLVNFSIQVFFSRILELEFLGNIISLATASLLHKEHFTHT